MGQNGGARPGAGRKPKADEIKLIESLQHLDDVAISAIEEGINARDYNYVKLFMEYRYGKPKQQVQLSNDPDNPFEKAAPIVNVYNTLPPLAQDEKEVDV